MTQPLAQAEPASLDGVSSSRRSPAQPGLRHLALVPGEGEPGTQAAQNGLCWARCQGQGGGMRLP